MSEHQTPSLEESIRVAARPTVEELKSTARQSPPRAVPAAADAARAEAFRRRQAVTIMVVTNALLELTELVGRDRFVEADGRIHALWTESALNMAEATRREERVTTGTEAPVDHSVVAMQAVKDALDASQRDAA